MPPSRLLIGPVEPDFAQRYLPTNPTDDCWSFTSAGAQCGPDQFFDGWRADAIVVVAKATSVPAWVWSAPVPVVVLAQRLALHWHRSRGILPLADIVLTSLPAIDRLRQAGLNHVHHANLYGLDHHRLNELDLPESGRDIDILLVNNLALSGNGDSHGLFNRLFGLVNRYRVRISTGAVADLGLLRNSRVVLHLNHLGECGQWELAAAAAGAVLFQEAENREVPLYFQPESEYVPYTLRDLEERLASVLGDEPRRAAIAGRARERARGYGFLPLIREALAGLGTQWDAVQARAATRAASPLQLSLSARVWQRVTRTGPDADPNLLDELRAAQADHALSLLARNASEAVPHLARAAVRGNRVSAVGHVAALLELGRKPEMTAVAGRALEMLDVEPILSHDELYSCPFPARFDDLRVRWERAGWDHPNDRVAEVAEKLRLLRCWVHVLVATSTGALSAFESAVAACPEFPKTRAALGCALARAGRFDEAAEHLTFAVAANPFDHAAAAALVAALADAGRSDDCKAVVESRRRLARAAPGLIREVEARAPNSRPPSLPRVVSLSLADFAAQFGEADTSHALSGFTPPGDTHIVLSLVASLKPLRVLEIGTAAGHMTANLTAWTPLEAIVFSLGLTATEAGSPTTGPQAYEVPSRQAFGRHANHFGTGHKAMFVLADSRMYDFARFAPLDFVFVDGGHDFETARSDSVRAYAALRPGGCLVWHDFGSRVAWVKVREAVASANFPETVYHVAGTEVAFLIKNDFPVDTRHRQATA